MGVRFRPVDDFYQRNINFNEITLPEREVAWRVLLLLVVALVVSVPDKNNSY